MFAVRDKRTGKYLKAFNGSFNHAAFYVKCAIAEEKLGGKKQRDMAVINGLNVVSYQEIVDKMWCLKTPNGGQLYKSEGAVKASIGDEDWMEIVPVKVVVDRSKK